MKTKLTVLSCVVAGAAAMGSLYAQEGKKTDAKPPLVAKDAANAVEQKEDAHAVMTEGVAPGRITQDYAAALAYAKEKKLPVLLIFTGSDWCDWCKVMDANVFKKPEWAAATKDTLVQVWLDFPKDKSLVPEKFQARNDELNTTYGVRGYPSYYLLDSDGSQIGKLGAGKTKTPASFKAEIDKLLVMTEGGIERFCATLKADDAAKVKAYYQLFKAAKDQQEATKAALTAITKQATDLEKVLRENMGTAKMNAMTPEVKAQYGAALAAKAAAQTKLNEWMKANQTRSPTPEQIRTYGELNKAIQDAQTKIDSF